MEIIAEIVLEILFECIKKKPEKRPEFESKDAFSIHTSKKRKTFFLSFYGLLTALFLFLSLLVDPDTAVLFYVLSALLFIIFCLSLFIFSTRYEVNTETVERTTLFLSRKNVLWQDVICVRIITQGDDDDIIIALYQKDGKLALDASTKFTNAWYLVKMAEDKGIEIREEKDLSLKKIKHL